MSETQEYHVKAIDVCSETVLEGSTIGYSGDQMLACVIMRHLEKLGWQWEVGTFRHGGYFASLHNEEGWRHSRKDANSWARALCRVARGALDLSMVSEPEQEQSK